MCWQFCLVAWREAPLSDFVFFFLFLFRARLKLAENLMPIYLHHRVSNLKAELSVSLELRLIEILICDRLVGKFRMRAFIAVYVSRHVSRDRRLDVKQPASFGRNLHRFVLRRSFIFKRGIVDLGNGKSAFRKLIAIVIMRVARRSRHEVGQIHRAIFEPYIDTLIYAGAFNRDPDVFEIESSVRACIGEDDHIDPAAKKLEDAGVFEVPAISQLDEVSVLVKPSVQYAAQTRIPERCAARLMVGFRISQPEPQAQIQKGSHGVNQGVAGELCANRSGQHAD